MERRDAATDEATDTAIEADENKLKERKVSWAKLRRVDSLNLEAGRVSTAGGHTSKVCPLSLYKYKIKSDSCVFFLLSWLWK